MVSEDRRSYNRYSSDEERREHPRHQISEEHMVIISESSHKKWINAFNCNVSSSGMRVETSEIIADTDVRIKIETANLLSAVLPAFVARQKEILGGYEYGITFETLIGSEKIFLERFIKLLEWETHGNTDSNEEELLAELNIVGGIDDTGNWFDEEMDEAELEELEELSFGSDNEDDELLDDLEEEDPYTTIDVEVEEEEEY